MNSMKGKLTDSDIQPTQIVKSKLDGMKYGSFKYGLTYTTPKEHTSLLGWLKFQCVWYLDQQ